MLFLLILRFLILQFRSRCHPSNGKPNPILRRPVSNLICGFIGIGIYGTYGCDNIITFSEIDQAHTLSGTSHHTNVGNVQTQRDAAAVYYHQVILIVNTLDSYKLAGLLSDVDCLDAFSSAVGDTIVLDVGAFSESSLGDDHNGFIRSGLHADHTNNFVRGIVGIKAHAAHTGGHASHLTDLAFVEADRTAIAVGHEYLAVAIGRLNLQQFIVFAYDNGVHTVCTRT